MKEQSEIVENLEEKNVEVGEGVTIEAEEVLEVSEEKVDAVEESISELEEIVEEAGSEVTEEVEEVVNDVASQVEDMNKHDASVLLVEKANIIVKDAEKQMDACKLLLSDDLKGYEAAKKALNEGGLNECETLLSELGYVDESEETVVEDGVVFEAKEDLSPIVLQDVSSGKFTGFILALLGGTATLAGLVYLATEKLGLTLDVTKVPSSETMSNIASWFPSAIDMPANPLIGGGFLLVVVLLVMWIIYAIRVNSTGSKNLHFAMKQLEEAEVYTAHKGNCKEEMDKVDVHIHDAIATLKTYQVLFNEQKGKLQRILHIEGEKEELSEYHQKSILEMKETQGLINAVRSFMATAMSEEGKLSGKSTLFLHSAKSKMQKMIERLY